MQDSASRNFQFKLKQLLKKKYNMRNISQNYSDAATQRYSSKICFSVVCKFRKKNLRAFKI